MELVKIDFERPLPENKEGKIVRSFSADFTDPKDSFWLIKWETLVDGRETFIGAKLEGKHKREHIKNLADSLEEDAVKELENFKWN